MSRTSLEKCETLQLSCETKTESSSLTRLAAPTCEEAAERGAEVEALPSPLAEKKRAEVLALDGTQALVTFLEVLTLLLGAFPLRLGLGARGVPPLALFGEPPALSGVPAMA